MRKSSTFSGNNFRLERRRPIALDCEYFEDQLSDYIDGTLDQFANKKLEGHLRFCMHCAETVNGMRRVRHTLHHLGADIPSAAFRLHLDCALSQELMRKRLVGLILLLGVWPLRRLWPFYFGQNLMNPRWNTRKLLYQNGPFRSSTNNMATGRRACRRPMPLPCIPMLRCGLFRSKLGASCLYGNKMGAHFRDEPLFISILGSDTPQLAASASNRIPRGLPRGL